MGVLDLATREVEPLDLAAGVGATTAGGSPIGRAAITGKEEGGEDGRSVP